MGYDLWDNPCDGKSFGGVRKVVGNGNNLVIEGNIVL